MLGCGNQPLQIFLLGLREIGFVCRVRARHSIILRSRWDLNFLWWACGEWGCLVVLKVHQTSGLEMIQQVRHWCYTQLTQLCSMHQLGVSLEYTIKSDLSIELGAAPEHTARNDPSAVLGIALPPTQSTCSGPLAYSLSLPFWTFSSLWQLNPYSS